ncbi:MAG: FIST N-terminal domain-containing protein [Rhodoferax sp.]|nr:FIST N-terminal domain-containing protein [Rhodoferax sp.]MDP3651688.1 FIST N-terminal domain-containing protein [Rhodoferax sp.]
MRTKSVSTTIVDPYRAALFLGQSLSEIQPEVVFLFATVHYKDWTEFMEGLHDGLDNPAVRVIGASGDGVHELARTSEVGASALGMCSAGQVQWHVATGDQVGTDPEGAVRRAVAQLAVPLEGRKPAFYFLLSDFNTDASRIETVVRDEIDVPVIGGMAADDNDKMEHCRLFANRAMVQDCVVMLAVDGPLSFQVHIGNSIAAVGTPCAVDEAQGRLVSRIGGVDAASFIERETGKPFLRSDQGSVALTILNAGQSGEKKLRAIAYNSQSDTGGLTLHGGIQNGDIVQVCLAKPEDLIAEVHTIATCAAASGFLPSAALIISCAGRKWLLGGEIAFEVGMVESAFGGTLPIAGFPSLGEIGPLYHQGAYTRNLFHNMTYVLLLLGKSDGH